MKYLVKFNESSNQFPTNPDSIKWVLKNSCELSNLGSEPTIHSDGTVDIDGDITLTTNNTSLPIKFGHVSGNFRLETPYLKSLEGCPRIVGNQFSCQCTDITDLIGGPEEVGHLCHYSNNFLLTSTEGAPKSVHQLWFHACRLLWNIQDLRDVSFGHSTMPIALNLTAVVRLQNIFGNHNLIHSLDYRYFREIPDWWFQYPKPSDPSQPIAGLNLFRFKEALDEFEVRAESFDGEIKYIRTSPTGAEIQYTEPFDRVGRYVFLDDSGNQVDFNGKRI